MATRLLACCTNCWTSRIHPHASRPPLEEALLKHAHDPLAPSLAHDAMSPGGVAAPRSSVRCASLSTCRPARGDRLGPADAAVPLHPIHPAARTTFGGRSSQSPQSLPRLPPPCQGSGSGTLCALHSLRRDAAKNSTRSLGRRSTPHRSPLGTPSLYYDTSTMSSKMSWVALRAPAARRRWVRCEQESNYARIVRLCQAVGAATCRAATTR